MQSEPMTIFGLAPTDVATILAAFGDDGRGVGGDHGA
jgi:hypothetical protein